MHTAEAQIISDSHTLRLRESPKHKVILSVDLGKAVDFTALSVVDVKRRKRKNAAGRMVEENHFDVLDVRRLPLGTTYTEVADYIYERYFDKRLWLNQLGKGAIKPDLLVDAGGVGDGVCDTVEKHSGIIPLRYKLVRGQMHAQGKPRHKTRQLLEWTVPRARVFSLLDAAFSSGRITIDKRLKLAKTLKEELANLKLEQDEETGYIRVTHREGAHDDLSITLAAAVWWADEKSPKPGHRMRIMGQGQLWDMIDNRNHGRY